MNLNAIFKRFCISLLLLISLSCSGGGGSGGGTSEDGVDNGEDNNTPSPDISISDSTYVFPGTIIGNSADQTFKITNSVNSGLLIGQISLSGSAFSIIDDTCSNTTLVADTCSVKVRFSPTVQGSDQEGTLSIKFNDSDQSEGVVNLNGDGYGLNVWINKITASDCQVTIGVTITDPNNPDLLLDSLSKDNFLLYQDQSSIEDFTMTPIQSPSPLSMVLAIDWSVSEIGAIDEIQNASNYFIDLLTDDDEVAICKFNSNIEFNPDITVTPSSLFYSGEDSALKSYIDDESFSLVAGTKLYDAIFNSLDRSAYGTKNKRAVIILSDGVDEGSSDGSIQASAHTLDEVIDYANDNGISLFTIFYFDPDYDEGDYGNTEVLQRLAKETGGQYYNGTIADLTDVYAQISNVLSNKYELSYTSSTCSGDVTLDIEVEDSNGLFGKESRTITFP